MIDCLVLGTGGAVPTRTRAPAAYWVTLDGHGLLVDPGPGALVRLLRDPRGPAGVDEIETVLLTHLHLDHCADLAPLLFALHSPLPAAEAPLQLIGPPGLRAYLDRLRDLYGDWLRPAKRPVAETELAPGERLELAAARPGEGRWRRAGPGLPGPSIAAERAEHGESRFSAANLCLRLTDGEGAVLAYSGDGEAGAGLLAAAREADLLLVECSTPDELYTPGHLTPSRVGELCAAARPRRVVLTHLYAPAAALDLPALVRRRFDGPVETAADGTCYRVGAGSPAGRPEPPAARGV